ncbi:MAG: aconitate hydratase AcnA [Phycisphaerales bacterium]
MSTHNDPFNARVPLSTPLGKRMICRLDALASVGDIASLPYSIRVLLEACLRNLDGFIVEQKDVESIARYDASKVGEIETPFMPGRVVLQDFTGVPAVVDLAALRSAMQRMGGDPGRVNPLVPCDLVIDHSVQVDAFNSGMAITINSQKEFERNAERYELLKWAQGAFHNFRVVPPATGIVHQVNLEYLGKVVWDDNTYLYPDSLVGTDSHTTMINGMGIVGWGVGGIEAEAVMLGQPIYMLLPEVVGFELTGALKEGCTATDLVLTVTQMLRQHGVVGKFVEFFGSGLDSMPLATRATIANMAPEYGATIGFFPVDHQTLRYMHLTGRDQNLIDTVEQYYKEQNLWRDARAGQIRYTSALKLDMATVEPSLSGPKRPQDRIDLSGMKSQWQQDLSTTFNKPTAANHSTPETFMAEGGQSAMLKSGEATAVVVTDPGRDGVEVMYDDETFTLKHGAVVIAAITSCTNTSNPQVMVGAGLLARNARKRGLTRQPWVKTSLAPGSKVVTEYLDAAGLTDELESLGFYLVGYGCTTCIGNSGPLPDPISRAIHEHDLVAASVLSGNRNFEGRISPDVRANYLASPPLVVAYAIAGTVNIDLTTEPLGQDSSGKDVYLRELWPSQAEIQSTIDRCVTREQFITQYANVFEGSDEWKSIDVAQGEMFAWDADSTYVQEPPFFVDMPVEPVAITSIYRARCLVKVGDSVTTDHISPAGSIKKDSPAGKFLQEHGVPVSMFNSYGSRRGNDRVMTRGTFANIRVRNHLAPGTEGGFTTFLGHDAQGVAHGSVTSIFDASCAYGACLTSDEDVSRDADGTPLIVLAGKDYGMGSSRDWAAKGTYLLGIRAVIAESFERIHRSNLVGMGVLPLTYLEGESADSLKLDGTETFDIDVPENLQPRQKISVKATRTDRTSVNFQTRCRIDTPVEVEYYRNGGILHTVLRKMARQES